MLITGLNTEADETAVIIYAADLPIIGAENHGDYAELATLLNESREASAQTPHFFLFGGASLAPSPLASFDSGSHIVDILNFLEPDAMSVTKREFSYFEDELTLRSYEAAFPLILSNVIDNQTGEFLEGISSDVVLTKLGFSIGIISILHPRVSEQYLLSRALILDPQNTIIRKAEQLRKQDVDSIVLLHSDYFPFVNSMLEQGIIELAIQSEPHDLDPENTDDSRHPNSVLIDRIGNAAVIGLRKKNGQTESSVDMVALEQLKPDPLVFSLISDYKSRLKSQLERPVGVIEKAFSTERTAVRTSENGFANMVTDAMRAEANTDLALLNAGSIRGDTHYRQGQTFVQADLLDELPFRSRMLVVEVTGKQLKMALENGLSKVQGVKGRFPHVAGMAYEFDPNLPSGERVLTITVQGKALDDKAIYTMATTDYLANGGDGYTILTGAKRRFEKAPTSPLISDVLGRSLKRQNKVVPVFDGRINIKTMENR